MTWSPALDRVAPGIETAIAEDDFDTALAAAAELGDPLDRFFEDVLVMADDAAVRGNRLRLLLDVRDTVGRLGDFGQIPRWRRGRLRLVRRSSRRRLVSPPRLRERRGYAGRPGTDRAPNGTIAAHSVSRVTDSVPLPQGGGGLPGEAGSSW